MDWIFIQITSIFSFLFLLAAIILWLGYFVFRRNREKKINQIFFILSAAISSWVLMAALADVLTNETFALISAQLAIIGPFIFSTFFLFFAYSFSSDETTPKWVRVFSYIILALVVIAVPTKINIEHFVLQEWGAEYTPGHLYTVLLVHFLFFVGFGVYKLIKTKQKLPKEGKAQIQFVLTGIGIMVILGVIANVVLPILGYSRASVFGPAASFFFIGSTAYAITRYRFMDLKAIVWRTIGFSVLVGTFFALYGFITYVVGRYLDKFSLSYTHYVIINVFGVIFAISGFRYYRIFLRRMTDRILFQDRVNYQKSLVALVEDLSSTINIEDVNATILQATESIVRARKAAILLRNETRFTISGEHGMRGFEAQVQMDNPLIRHLRHSQRIVIKSELAIQREQEDFPAHKKEIKAIENVLDWLDVVVVVPLFVHKELTGLILLGDKMSGEPYLQEDISFLSAFAPQAATALENARLYKESLEFGEKLKEEVRKATSELESANKELQKLDKNKSEFMSIASHQLYTPTTALRGYLSMLLEGDYGKLNKEQKEVVGTLEQSTLRLIDLIKNLLDISRIESGRLELNLESVNLADVARELVNELMPNAKGKGLELNFHEPKENTPAVVDSQRIRQVMLNFIDNAIKYTPEGKVDVSVDIEGDNITFSVVDTGKGISAEDLKRLFNKFTRVGGASRFHTEGTGLGLYVARQIVKEHHGDVQVDSGGEGKGSTFSMILPKEGTSNSLKPGEKAEVVIKAAEVTGQQKKG